LLTGVRAQRVEAVGLLAQRLDGGWAADEPPAR